MKFLWTKYVVSSFVTVLALFAASFIGIAPVGAADHGQLVGESPRRDLPVVLDGEVRAHALIGDRIFVGGEFQQVQRPDGTTITQPNIFAFNINTGLLDENFRPVVNNGVLALEVNPRGDALYAGGRFVTWDGSFVDRLVKLDAFGNRDTSFQSSASAVVRSLAVTNEDVYLAGDFFWVGGEYHAGFAAVDANTGAIDSGFNMNVENTAATGQLARGIVVTSDGNTVFGLHFGTSINGNLREALVKIDTSGGNAGLADWRVDWSGQTPFRTCLSSLRDIAISPDDSFIVIGGQGADNPPNCDSVLRYPTAGTGLIGYDWSARMYSSVLSVAVSDTAVYVGGHFCAAPLNGAEPGGQTHERTDGTANRCEINDPNDPVNPSVIFPNYAVFRKQLAALDPSDGRALAWDPGSNAFLGTFDLTIIDRGLLAGMDENRYNQILTGRSGLFDFGGFTPPAPAPVVAACVVEVINNVPVVSYSDFPNVTKVNILRNGSWIATDTSATPGSGTYDDTSALPGVAYSYVIRSRPGGVVTDVACSPATITIEPPPPVVAACAVEVINNVPVVSYSGFTDVSNVQFRRNNGWIGSGLADAGTFDDTSAVPGVPYSYVIRSRPGGVVTDVACTPATITIDVPVETSCSVSLNNNNEPMLSYSGFTNVTNVQFRRNNGWIGSGLADAGTFDDTSAVPGVPYSYVIRSRPGGVVTDLACTPAAFTF